MTEIESEDDRVRGDLVVQLKESLARSKAMLSNDNLDNKTRERWTQVHTNTVQVLNQVLRDRQFKDWEKRLGELEARRRKLHGSIQRLETLAAVNQDQTGGS